MPVLKSVEDLKQLREEAQQAWRVRRATGTRIIVGMGTCGIAAGSDDVMNAILQELDKRQIEAQVVSVGCIGMCYQEPLVDVEQAGRPRITYGGVKPDMVPRIIEEHLVNGRVVEEWAVGRLPTD